MFAAASPSRPAFPPDHLAASLTHGIRELLRQLLRRRQRVNPRVVKRAVVQYPVKRRRHYRWPRPPCPIADAIAITRHDLS